MAKTRSQQISSTRRWRDDREAILEFNRSITLIVDPSALTASIAARLSERFRADRIVLLRAAPDSLLLEVAFSSGYNADDLKTVRLSQHNRMVKWMLTNESLLTVGSDPGVFNYLSEAERTMLTRLDTRVCAPLVALNHLTGLILLSSTQKDWNLNEEDLSLLEMLTSQAGIAFENAYLAEQQRERLRRLYRAERLATAGQLASSVAHEIRNPLTSIRSTVQYLLGEFPEDHPKRSLIEGVILEVDRIDRTVDGLLNLTRQVEFKPERISLDEVISQTLLLVSTQARNQRVEIRFSNPAASAHILGDASRLKQLFLNLILNSLQAMTAGGRLTIAIDEGNRHAQVSISDTGCGIAAENLDKVFDPFFTTRQGGTGLGLPISYTIARQHGGEMEIKSQPGEGTTVAVRFPVVR
ncbi:MAG TPA: ATP-binding protein [Blastocatellia bacterium]